jgi:hypothetical protein
MPQCDRAIVLYSIIRSIEQFHKLLLLTYKSNRLFQNSIHPNAPWTQALDAIDLLLEVPLDQGMFSGDGSVEANMDRGTYA